MVWGGEWEMGNGEWGMGNGKWGIGLSVLEYRLQKKPFDFSKGFYLTAKGSFNYQRQF